jgi:hypothetical protein
MVSDRGFDYSWDDQDPDQMTDFVSGELGSKSRPRFWGLPGLAELVKSDQSQETRG